MMEYPLSELIDRMTILSLKCERAPGNAAMELERFRLSAYAAAVHRGPFNQFLEWRDALRAVNGKIWDLEADIRLGREGVLGLEEVGRRALAIRDLNAERVRIKNEIARETEGFEETKINHASAIVQEGT